jgi:hypothetical protein
MCYKLHCWRNLTPYVLKLEVLSQQATSRAGKNSTISSKKINENELRDLRKDAKGV